MNKLCWLSLLATSIFGVAALAVTPQLGSKDNEKLRVLWPETEAYDAEVSSFPISPDEAVEIANVAYEKSQDRSSGLPKVWHASSKPRCIVGDYYCLTMPTKSGKTALGGIYVNGRSGKLEGRVSGHSIQSPRRYVSIDVFKEIRAEIELNKLGLEHLLKEVPSGESSEADLDES